jgi:glutamyl-tRNA synthetase
MTHIRTRFAPSPTGFLHVGNVRAALFPWLVAQQAKAADPEARFVLRVEDTDRAREVPGAVKVMQDTLGWLGLTWDEGPDIGGPFAPYLQTQRLDHYTKWAKVLIDKGYAYADPYTAQEVEAFREQAKANRQPFLYRNHRPENPPAWDGTQPLRFKVPEIKSYHWHDAIMGDLSAGPEALDDFILIKSDGLPTYNFAHIVDDHEMQITHVIRGLEYIASMPKYLALYDALGIPHPVFAHAPHIMAPDGKKKLGKRDGAKSVLDYRKEGYLPEAMLNFLASMGWNDGTEQEIFSRDELVQKFSLGRVQRSGARFDEQRLLWMQGMHIRRIPLDTLYGLVTGSNGTPGFWPAEAFEQRFSDDDRRQILGLVQERLKFFHELPELTLFFFKDLPVNPELWTTHKQLKKVTPAELKSLLQRSRDLLAGSDFTLEALTEALNNLLEQTGQKPAVLFSLIRIATTQSPASPGLADTLALLGKQTSLRRIDAMLATL